MNPATSWSELHDDCLRQRLKRFSAWGEPLTLYALKNEAVCLSEIKLSSWFICPSSGSLNVLYSRRLFFFLITLTENVSPLRVLKDQCPSGETLKGSMWNPTRKCFPIILLAVYELLIIHKPLKNPFFSKSTRYRDSLAKFQVLGSKKKIHTYSWEKGSFKGSLRETPVVKFPHYTHTL